MTVQGGEGMDVIIDGGNGVFTAGPAQGPGIGITGVSSVVHLENLTIRGFAAGSSSGAGIGITGGSTAVTVIDCRTQANEVDGIAHGGSSTSHDVIGSEITQNLNGISQSGRLEPHEAHDLLPRDLVAFGADSVWRFHSPETFHELVSLAI